MIATKKILIITLSLLFILTLTGCKEDTSITSNTTSVEENTKIIREDVCGLYLQVLEDLWNVDPGLNSEISQIGIDLSELSDLTEDEKGYVMSEFALKRNLPYVIGTFEELCEQGYIDKENLMWKDGLLFTIKTNEDGKTFNAKKWRSGFGAYFFDQCSAHKSIFGKWSYKVGSQAIS